jgi:hypothetical protein
LPTIPIKINTARTFSTQIRQRFKRSIFTTTVAGRK